MEQQYYNFDLIKEDDLNRKSILCDKLRIFENPKYKAISSLIDPNNPSKAQDSIRFVCISDTHNNKDCFKNIPDGDVLIHAGDFTQVGRREEITEFIEEMEKLPHKHKVIIAGNHDISLDFEKWKTQREKLVKRFRQLKTVEEPVYDLKEELRSKFTYLEDESAVVEGYKVYGSPWSLYFFDWGFNLREKEAREKWQMIEEDSEIVVTHGPALGFGDRLFNGNRCGCIELLRRIKQVKPLIHVSGHIHEDHGIWTDGDTHFINASSLDIQYACTNRPVVFDLPKKK